MIKLNQDDKEQLTIHSAQRAESRPALTAAVSDRAQFPKAAKMSAYSPSTPTHTNAYTHFSFFTFYFASIKIHIWILAKRMYLEEKKHMINTYFHIRSLCICVMAYNSISCTNILQSL